MILIVGLGNPGKNFQKTRHNIGFRTIDNLQLTSGTFSNWRIEKKLLAEISEGKIANKKVILIKPQTFMNASGKAVKLLTKTYNLKTKNLYVIHDDFDLPLDKIRISKARGAAGHKGVESIIKELKTKNFVRFRIGTKPITYNLKPKTINQFVLQKFNKEEEKNIKEVIKRTIEAIETAIKEGIEKAMTEYNC